MPETPVFKIKISDILVGANTVRVGAFIAPSPDRTFQRCGELTLTQREAGILKKLVEAPEVKYEYAAIRIRTHDRARMAWPDLYWTDDKEDIEELVETMNNAGRAGYTHSYVVAKRIKAGEIEYT